MTAVRFPLTRDSLLDRARSADLGERRSAVDALVRAYWLPAYAYVRVRFRLDRERAEDVVQAFFTKSAERGLFDTFDASRAKFRTFIRSALDHFVANDLEAGRRQKRGGGLSNASLEDVEDLLSDPAATDAEEAFHRVWVLSVLDLALAELERTLGEERAVQLAVFRAVVIDPELDRSVGERPSYQEIAAKFSLTEAQVTNYLHRAKKELRKILLRTLRELTSSEEELASVAPAFLGAPPYE